MNKADLIKVLAAKGDLSVSDLQWIRESIDRG